jgi:hypothetical protein
MTLHAGETFAGYTIVRQIGSGGMGEVYLAQHPRLPRQEALKILHPDLTTDHDFRRRFIRKADSIAALPHPNIVTVHDRAPGVIVAPRGRRQGALTLASIRAAERHPAAVVHDHHGAAVERAAAEDGRRVQRQGWQGGALGP